LFQEEEPIPTRMVSIPKIWNIVISGFMKITPLSLRWSLPETRSFKEERKKWQKQESASTLSKPISG
jgi:hypothetical protein